MGGIRSESTDGPLERGDRTNRNHRRRRSANVRQGCLRQHASCSHLHPRARGERQGRRLRWHRRFPRAPTGTFHSGRCSSDRARAPTSSNDANRPRHPPPCSPPPTHPRPPSLLPPRPRANRPAVLHSPTAHPNPAAAAPSPRPPAAGVGAGPAGPVRNERAAAAAPTPGLKLCASAPAGLHAPGPRALPVLSAAAAAARIAPPAPAPAARVLDPPACTKMFV